VLETEEKKQQLPADECLNMWEEDWGKYGKE